MRPDSPLRRVRFTVAYDGTDFHGWQIQPGLPTIQRVLEEILTSIEGSPVTVHGSGRTDAGVHAQAQVAACSITNPIPVSNLHRALNRLLPHSIRVLETADAPLDFHPRFDALAKTYEYRLYRGEICPPPLFRYVHHHPYPLALEPMHNAAQLFEGEHDFSSFAASDPRDAAPGNNARSKVRRIFSSSLTFQNETLFYRVRGSGFLKHMVRNLVAALLESGKGNLSHSQIHALLQPGFPAKWPHTAPAKGLHLISVEYPDRLPL